MSITAGFLRQKFPKRYAHVVEECDRLDVSELLMEFSPLDRRIVHEWSPTAYPWLTVVRGRRGKVDPFWHVLCPRCRRPCETLYRPPNAQPNDWRCRRCHSLVYASQRYGFRHPLRRRPTHRKRVKAQRQAARQWRRDERRHAQAEKERRRAAHRDPLPARCAIPREVLTGERVVVVESMPGKPGITVRSVSRAELDREQHERGARELAASDEPVLVEVEPARAGAEQGHERNQDTSSADDTAGQEGTLWDAVHKLQTQIGRLRLALVVRRRQNADET